MKSNDLHSNTNLIRSDLYIQPLTSVNFSYAYIRFARQTVYCPIFVCQPKCITLKPCNLKLISPPWQANHNENCLCLNNCPTNRRTLCFWLTVAARKIWKLCISCSGPCDVCILINNIIIISCSVISFKLRNEMRVKLLWTPYLAVVACHCHQIAYVHE